MVRCMRGHAARVSSLSWNGPILSSGGRSVHRTNLLSLYLTIKFKNTKSIYRVIYFACLRFISRDSVILNHDVRIKEHVIDQLRYHQQEVLISCELF